MPTVKDLIERARREAGGSRNAPTIVARLLFGPIWRETLTDEPVLRQVMRAGWDHYTRQVLKEAQEILDRGTEGTEPDQLELWPVPLRGLVKSINRKAVYVPSRQEFVPLAPGELTQAEAVEAGRYLVEGGRADIRCGERLIELGGTEWSTSH